MLILIAGDVGAQVVRVDRADRMSDKRVVALVVPDREGRAAFYVGCEGAYSIRAPELAGYVAAPSLLVRLDRFAPMAAAGVLQRPQTLTITPEDKDRFSMDLDRASQLVVRLNVEPFREYEFDWRTDNKGAFGAAVEIAGGGRLAAMAGYEMLTQGLSRAAAGQYRALADLMSAMKLKWREQGRPVDTGLLIGPIMSAMRKNQSKKEVEDAGLVMFGPAWTAVRSLLLNDAVAYADINRGMDVQLSWLRRNCPPGS